MLTYKILFEVIFISEFTDSEIRITSTFRSFRQANSRQTGQQANMISFRKTITERGFLGSGICSPVSKMFNTVMFCVLLVVLFLWCYPSHGTGSREGAFNQQER